MSLPRDSVVVALRIFDIVYIFGAISTNKASGSATGSCIAVIQLKKTANNFDGKKRRKQKMQILLRHKPQG